MPSLRKRDLFGGAITAETALDLKDASDIRQVPDTQEVFLYPDSNASIIVEILQKVEASAPHEIVKFHFDSLAHDNDACASTVQAISVVANDRGDDTPGAILLRGLQHVPKFNKMNADCVQILMAVLRVEQKDVDVVVTFNVPVSTEDGGAVGEAGLAKVVSDFDAFVKSFRIVDFSLFA